MTWTAWFCSVMLSAAFITDIFTRKIPNKLTMTACAAAVVGHGIMNGWNGIAFSVAGALSGFGFMLLLFLVRAVGAGDVKLFAAIGAFMGMQFTWETIIYSILYGGLIAALILLVGRKGRMKRLCIAFMQVIWLRTWIPLKLQAARQATFPFMWAVLPAAVTVYYSQLL
ncbi:A24 family peptidase [Paenibacillus apiarius]|uniref:A24 family peptidase n=1 Tax=Paenibacillus apiarius TaxID=46240 RepID=A0ABT4DY67_9BACL|nr:A24 family peptidase [Paenibacillus apiarius]MBN3523338.1 prepilin peptidase [Paenibacillus apiarius]MCY9514439.1 A24 family peptidase [Paenibacillus apiarius]MCY9521023.1 A24 family peptidase [Paenibacillus apiarius]MCY9551869.1 A24 family peptidase [Paenibacillus apiarius]MCY9557757.1 A24 family peptidase [Paenibacillus apiarius]